MVELRIGNPVRGQVLAERARLADTFWTRAVGLLGSRDVGGGLVLEPCSSVHTWFMGYAIDVLFLDLNGRVLAVYAAMPPWRMTRWVRGATRVVELAAGGARATEVGDQLECVPCALS